MCKNVLCALLPTPVEMQLPFLKQLAVACQNRLCGQSWAHRPVCSIFLFTMELASDHAQMMNGYVLGRYEQTVQD